MIIQPCQASLPDSSRSASDIVGAVQSYRAKVIENMKDAWAKFSASNKNEDLSQIKIYKKDQDLLDFIKKAEGTTSASKIVGQLIQDEYNRICNNE